jgi:SAM-dependent methyltransferase
VPSFGENVMPQPHLEKAAHHWNQWQADHEDKVCPWNDWADHPLIQRLILDHYLKCPGGDLFSFLQREVPELAGANALSLCCGDAAFEINLITNNLVAHITGIDIADVRIAAARQRTQGALAVRFDFRLIDANIGNFGTSSYDIVFAKAALHHIEQLENCFNGMKRCLKPGGVVVALDYFGPDRLQWPLAQVELANTLLETYLPDDSQRRLADGSIYRVSCPDMAALVGMDPSEAVRSSEIMYFFQQHFFDVKAWSVGGTLLSLIFPPDILIHLSPDDPSCAAAVRQAFSEEAALIESGAIDSNFYIVVARNPINKF